MAKTQASKVEEIVLPETENASIETENVPVETETVKSEKEEKNTEKVEAPIIIPDNVVEKSAEKMVKVRIISDVTNLYILGARYTYRANTDAYVNSNVAVILRQSKMAL